MEGYEVTESIILRMSDIWDQWRTSPYHEDMSFADWLIRFVDDDTIAKLFSDASDATEPTT